MLFCKYFESHSGCTRGSKSFYAHGEEKLRKMNPRMHLIRASKEEFKNKIFVGGLFWDSDSLGVFFEKHFVPIEDARVVGIPIEKQIHSQGFGFATIKHKKSTFAAVQAHVVTITGKQVEIISAMPKELSLAELQKQSAQQQDSKHEHQSQLQAKNPGEITMEEAASGKFKGDTEEVTPEEKSWPGRLLRGQAKTSSNKSEAHIVKRLGRKKCVNG